MTYRATNVTQKDGSALQWSNCRMAVAATHLDFHTQGAKKSTGAKMRSYQDDKVGGTDSGDARTAWERGYEEALVIRDGRYWGDLVEDRDRGWFVSVDVWYASLPDRCQQSGNFGHTIGIAPENNGTKWLVGDPLCAEGQWKWMEAADIKAAAENWGTRILNGTSSKTHGPDGEGERLSPVDTGGAVPIRYTTAVEEAVALKVTDQKPRLLDVAGGVKLYDVNGQPTAQVYSPITQGLSPFASMIGKTVAARAVYVSVGGVRQLMLIRTADAKNLKEIPTTVDIDALLDARDGEWIARLTPPRT